ncbi:MAG: biotin/lipoyl-containing protein, partial [Vulcanimicrobiaceae bacterium]
MSQTIEVRVPDIGDFRDVPVIDVLVKPGDHVEREAPLVTLESEKATMDVPATHAGTVQELKVKVGDKLSEGSTVLVLATADAETPPAATQAAVAAPVVETAPAASTNGVPAPVDAGERTVEVRVPDIGDFKDVPVIDVLVKPGDHVAKEAPLVSLESEKATMDVPATEAGVVRNVALKAGDKVSQGTLVATLGVAGAAPA